MGKVERRENRRRDAAKRAGWNEDKVPRNEKRVSRNERGYLHEKRRGGSNEKGCIKR